MSVEKNPVDQLTTPELAALLREELSDSPKHLVRVDMLIEKLAKRGARDEAWLKAMQEVVESLLCAHRLNARNGWPALAQCFSTAANELQEAIDALAPEARRGE